MEKNWKYKIDYIPVLDGIRALAIFIVAWYHIWLISWLQPVKEVPFLKIFNIQQINLDWMVRTGYQMVDVMLLLSGFCLFLPYAKSMVLGEKEPELKKFYKNRVARICPSYYICIIVMLIFAFVRKEFASNGDMWKDLLSHLFFVQNYSKVGYMSTKLNGVLWTLAVEVQFYLIFPLIAKCFKKKPVWTYGIMVATSWIFDNWVIIKNVSSDSYGMWINQLPTFLSVYANGMMAALIVVKFSEIFNQYMAGKDQEQAWESRKVIGCFFTGILILGMYVYYKMMKDLTASGQGQLWQINNRFEFSLLFSIVIVSCVFAVPLVEKVLGNKVMHFLSGISFQVYIWHQVIANKLLQYRIPSWEGEQTPNVLGDRAWMWKYFILCWTLTILVSTLVTYGIEKPCGKWIRGLHIVKKKEQ